MSLPPAHLSCEQCKLRKTKCNKQLPACSACVKAGIDCTVVQRHRLPRGRTSKKDSHRKGLKARIERLEAALATLDHESRDAYQSRPEREAITRTDPSSFVAPEFWGELSETMAGMREVLETSGSQEEVGEEEDDSVARDLCSDLFSTSPAALTYSRPGLEEESRLLDIYHIRVHTIFRVLHWPSLLASLISNTKHERDSVESVDLQALRAAIYFAATCSLHAHELGKRRFGVDHYRRMAESALVRANLFATTSLVTLQAFVVYLAGLRACQANAQQWTLTAVAIRIATAQGIPSKHFSTPDTLDEQLKRRLWCCIGLLDMQSAFDRGSKPLLQSTDLGLLPLNINDDNFFPDSRMPLPAGDRFTDMSFSLLVYRAGFCQRKLTELGLSAASSALDPEIARHEQAATLADFESHVKVTIAMCETPLSTIQMFTKAVGEESVVAMRLLQHRPLHHRGRMSPFNTYMKAEKIDVLVIATEVLERSQYKRGEGQFAQWAWFSWVKWYALAVVLAELCTVDNDYADHAWKVAQRSFEDYANAVADAKSGLLWKPVARLMLKVKQLRGHGAVLSNRTQDDAHDRSGPSNPVTSNAVVNLLSRGSPGAGQLCEVDDFSSFLQTSLDCGNTISNSGELPWDPWNMLIDDLNNPELLISEDLSSGLPAFGQLE